MKSQNQIQEYAYELMEDSSFEQFAELIKSEKLTQDDVLAIFDEIEAAIPHANFQNVDRLLKLAA